MISLIDEESKFPKATDESLLEVTVCDASHAEIEREPRKAPKVHQISQPGQIHGEALRRRGWHLLGTDARKATYNIAGFLEKNKHMVTPDVTFLFLASKDELIAAMFGEKEGTLTARGSLGTPVLGRRTRLQTNSPTVLKRSNPSTVIVCTVFKVVSPDSQAEGSTQ